MKLAFIRHLHPSHMDPARVRFTYTFCLGGSALFFFLLLAITGGLLLFHYVPLVNGAEESLTDITSAVPFGKLIRNLHYWAGQFMVVALIFHMVRVVVTGSYVSPRRLNWVVGLALFVLTVLTDFTGYLLRWDAVGRMAATVGVNIMEKVPLIGPMLRAVAAGGEPLGQTALLRYYIFHCFLLPGIMAAGIMYHFWRVREDGRIRPL